ncbi:MAG: putative ABC transporter permease [Oscillibacter sp.]|nr:putative ABC transporter permease [Oscillibacter sp.]
MGTLLWLFWIYSFLGYLLERAFAALTRSARRTRRCFLVSPLCPVYGLGMLAVLAAAPYLGRGWGLVLGGGLAATAVEYAVHWWYERVLGVRFWDYGTLPGNLRGRVCLPFSAAWGGLTALAVVLLQPWVESLARSVPWAVTYGCLLAFTADAWLSARRLLRTGDPEALRWAGPQGSAGSASS